MNQVAMAIAIVVATVSSDDFEVQQQQPVIHYAIGVLKEGNMSTRTIYSVANVRRFDI